MDINQIKKQGIAKAIIGEIQRCQNNIRQSCEDLKPDVDATTISPRLTALGSLRKWCDEAEILLMELQKNNRND